MMNRQTRSPLHMSANLLTPQIITGVHGRIKQRPSTDSTTNSRLLQTQTVGDWREAPVTRRVILRSFEGESDGKSYIHNRKEISLIQNHYNYQTAVPDWLSTQGHVTKTRSGRILVPPVLRTFDSDFALMIFDFFGWFFRGGPTYFLVFSLSQKRPR